MAPSVLAGTSATLVAGFALIDPPGSPAQYAKSALGADGYAKAFGDARTAISRGTGGTTMVIAPYEANRAKPARRQWLVHMARGFESFWGAGAPPAPVPFLAATGKPLLLIGAGEGRFIRHRDQTALASASHAESEWYDGAASPFALRERMTSDLIRWLNKLPRAGNATHAK